MVNLGGQSIAIQAAKNFRTLLALGITVRKTIDTVIATRCIERSCKRGCRRQFRKRYHVTCCVSYGLTAARYSARNSRSKLVDRARERVESTARPVDTDKPRSDHSTKHRLRCRLLPLYRLPRWLHSQRAQRC